MTDLAHIFTSHKMQPQKINSIRLQHHTHPHSSRVLPVSQPRKEHVPIDQCANTKRIITYSNMHEEVDWFRKKYRVEGLAKIVLINILICTLFYHYSWKLSVGLGAIAVSTLSLALRHNIFGNSKIETWAFVSLIYSLYVLTNQLFLFFLFAINTDKAEKLHNSCLSLIPSIHLSSFLFLVLLNGPLILPSSRTSIIEHILSIPTDILFSLSQIFRIRVIILQLYAGTMIATILAIGMIFSKNEVSVYLSMLSLQVLASQFFALLSIYVLLFILLFSFSELISSMFVRLSYKNKNKFTNIPNMLELIRVTPSSNNTLSIPVIANMYTFNTEIDRHYSLTREKAEIMYSHCIKWITHLLIFNHNILGTKIITSKFYHKYSDIFQEFVQKQMQRCQLKLQQLFQQLRSYDCLRSKEKSLKQDMFFWIKVKYCRICIWFTAVEAIRYLKLSDELINILSTSNCKVWTGIHILKRCINQLKYQCQQLQAHKDLNEILRDTICEYRNKYEHALHVLGN